MARQEDKNSGKSARYGANIRVVAIHLATLAVICVLPYFMSDYLRMLPGGESLRALIAIVRTYVGDEFNWDVHLILDRHEVRPAQLGEFGQLGWTTWMSESEPEENPDDLYLNPMLEII